MMKFLAGVIATTALILGGFFVGQTYFLQEPVKTTAPLAGNFNTTGGGTYNLQATITSSQTTISLSSFTEPQSNIAYTMSYLNSSIEYATIAPQTSQSEFVSFTGITQNSDGSATLTGVQRGLDRSYPYTASSTLALPHAGQSRFILSNPPQVYNSYGALTNANTWSAVNTFSSTSPPTYDTDPVWANFSTQIFADVAYVNSVVAAGAANASETVKGIIQLATGAQAALGTSAGSTGARLALGNNLATSTPYNGGTNVIPVTGINEKLSQLFLDLTQSFTFLNFIQAPTSTIGSLNVGNINATSSIKINGVPVLTSVVVPHYTLASSFDAFSGAGTITATSSALSIPAGLLTASSTVNITAVIQSNHGNTGGAVDTFYLRTAAGVTLGSCSDGITATAVAYNGQINISIVFNNALNSENIIMQCSDTLGQSTWNNFSFGGQFTGSVDMSQAFGLVMVGKSGAANDEAKGNFNMVVNP